MIKQTFLVGVASVALISSAAMAEPIPTAPAYPTAPAQSGNPRPGTSTPRPSPAPTPQPDAAPTPPHVLAELPSLDEQLSRGWITPEQADILRAELDAGTTTMARHLGANFRDYQRFAQPALDQFLQDFGNLGTGGQASGDLAALGYATVDPNDPNAPHSGAQANGAVMLALILMIVASTVQVLGCGANLMFMNVASSMAS